MSISVMTLDLSKWEEVARDALVLPVFREDRPLRGAAGLVDWRLCGRLSRLMRSGKASGVAGESLLLPASRRLRFTRILWFGLGEAKGYNEDRARRDLQWIARVSAAAGVTDLAMQLPGRSMGLLGARRAVELLFECPTFDATAVTIIEDSSGQKDIADVLRQRS
ncbi:MAG: M17 family peptidase N-terminal domain-containing protein [Kofleriaceae bacterium]